MVLWFVWFDASDTYIAGVTAVFFKLIGSTWKLQLEFDCNLVEKSLCIKKVTTRASPGRSLVFYTYRTDTHTTSNLQDLTGGLDQQIEVLPMWISLWEESFLVSPLWGSEYISFVQECFTRRAYFLAISLCFYSLTFLTANYIHVLHVGRYVLLTVEFFFLDFCPWILVFSAGGFKKSLGQLMINFKIWYRFQRTSCKQRHRQININGSRVNRESSDRGGKASGS